MGINSGFKGLNPQIRQKSNSNRFATPALGGCTWSNPGCFNAGKRHVTHCTGGWVGSQGPSVPNAKNLASTGFRTSDRSARNELLVLHYTE